MLVEIVHVVLAVLFVSIWLMIALIVFSGRRARRRAALYGSRYEPQNV